MSTLDTIGVGAEHNRLVQVAEQLRNDEHDALAAEYQERADEELKVYAELLRLGEEAKRQRAIVDDDLHVGKELAERLVRNGWTPPTHFAGRITE